MNKNIFRNRTIIGAVCILLAVLVCFGITPLFNAGLKAQTEAVRVKAEVIPRGTYITADMVEVYTRGASGMSDAIATSLDEVVGRYTDVELRKNTDVNTGWLSSEPLTQYEYLTKLDGSKVAISVTIPTFAKGGSGKVEAGDIIMLFATDKDTGETTQPPEVMQEEVEQRIVSLMISCGKLGEQEFRKAVAKLLEQLKSGHQKHQYSKANPHGKMTVKQLAAKDKGLQSIEVTDQNIGSFNRIARKYGIDFAPFKVKGEKRYMVFFKAPDADAMTAAFKEYTTKQVRKAERPSVLEKLQHFKSLIQAAVVDRTKRKELER